MLRAEAREAALERSKFRSRFRLSPRDFEYLNKSGLDKIRTHAWDFILTRLAAALPEKDGRQTPFQGHPVFKAQHATATCCRGCLQKWYGIEKGRPLSAGEVEMIVAQIMKWIKSQAGGRQTPLADSNGTDSVEAVRDRSS
jgi:hypothetical protein